MPRQLPAVIIGLAVLALVAAAAAQGDPRNTLLDLLLLVPAAGVYFLMLRHWFGAPEFAADAAGQVVAAPMGPGPMRWLMRTVGLALVLAALCLAGAADFTAMATGRSAAVLGVMLVAGWLLGRK